MTRAARTAALIVAVAASLAAPSAAAAATGGERPNVLVIETDDQTAASMWAMPIVQRELADQGTTFDNSFVSYSLCCPSRSTFLTGQYAHNHGVFSNDPPLGGYYKLDSTNTLPVWLRAAGYRTMHVGKYLNRYGTKNATEIPPGWDDWFTTVDPSTYRYYGYTLNENGKLVKFPNQPAYYQTDVESRLSSQLMAREAGDRKPFFLWTTFLAPHSSAVESNDEGDPPNFPTPTPAPQDQGRFAGVRLPHPPSFNEANVSDKPRPVRSLAFLTPDRIAAIQKNYEQELETLQSVDRAVGRMLDTLRQTGQLDNTVIVYTSDNGFFHGEHRRAREKVFPYEPSIRVPLIVRGPGLPQGVHAAQLVSNQDLAPTIADVARARPGRVEDGMSLIPLMEHPEAEPGRDLLIEGAYMSGGVQNFFSGIRTRRWFYAEYSDGERELYDLVSDPDELISRHRDPAYADIREHLAGRLARLRTCRGASCLANPLLRLRLGYRKAHSAGGTPCAVGPLRVSLAGPARSRVQAADLYVGDRLAGSGLGARSRFRLSPGRVPRRAGVTFRVTAYLTQDQAYTVSRRLPFRLCRHPVPSR